MGSDVSAVLTPIGVAVLDYAAGRPADTGDLAAEVVLACLTILFASIKSAPIQAVGRLLIMTLPSLAKKAVTDWLASRKRAGK